MIVRQQIILGWLLTPLFLFFILFTVLIWHPLLVLSRSINLGLHQRLAALGNLLITFYLRLLGGSISIFWPPLPPEHGPVIIISNHQSLFDIPIFVWIFRRYQVRFVAKKSLGKWLPSISYVLRTGGSALIDRSDSNQALPAIAKLGNFIVTHRCAACIFPEGTRARDGKLKSFRPAGAKTLLETAPEAPVLPVAITGAWEIMRYGFMPVPFGIKVRVTILPPIARSSGTNEEILHRCRDQIAEIVAKQ